MESRRRARRRWLVRARPAAPELETLIAEAVARALASRCGESPGESSIERGG